MRRNWNRVAPRSREACPATRNSCGSFGRLAIDRLELQLRHDHERLIVRSVHKLVSVHQTARDSPSPLRHFDRPRPVAWERPRIHLPSRRPPAAEFCQPVVTRSESPCVGDNEWSGSIRPWDQHEQGIDNSDSGGGGPPCLPRGHRHDHRIAVDMHLGASRHVTEALARIAASPRHH